MKNLRKKEKVPLEKTRKLKNLEILEADTRKVYVRETKQFDQRKLRATDVKGNAMLHLPPPLIPSLESEILVRNEEFKKVFREYREEFTNEGKQKENLNKTHREGLRKLKDRIKKRGHNSMLNGQNW